MAASSAVACSGEGQESPGLDEAPDGSPALRDRQLMATDEPEELAARRAADQSAIAELDASWRARYTDAEAHALLEARGFVPPTYERLLAEDERLRAEPLAPAEESAIRERFSGAARTEPLTFEGRRVQWGDMLFSADELLTADKAQICTTNQTTGSCLDNAGTPFARIDADGSADTLPFRRPDVLTATFLVVPDNLPDFVFDALTATTSAIEGLNAPGDCLGSNTFFVIDQTTFDATSDLTRASNYAVAVNYLPGECAGALACAGLPGFKNVFVAATGATESRVALGKTTLGLNSDRLTADGDLMRSTLLHELGHMMGRSHPESDGSAGLIPGTSTQLLVQSVMCAPDASCASINLSSDDILAIATLYSDSPGRANDGCAYDPAFRTFTPL